MYTTPGTGGEIPNVPTGWEQAAGAVKEFDVPESWVSGRIWGRTGCDFSTNLPGPTQCQTGGCNGGLLCDPQTGTGVPPASLVSTISSAPFLMLNYNVGGMDIWF